MLVNSLGLWPSCPNHCHKHTEWFKTLIHANLANFMLVNSLGRWPSCPNHCHQHTEWFKTLIHANLANFMLVNSLGLWPSCPNHCHQHTHLFSGRSPGHRLPWSQVLEEKVSLLPVRHTYRMPYLLFAYQISISKNPGLLPITGTRHPKNPGRCGPVIFSIQLRFWGWSPRTRPGRTSDLGRQNANI